MCLSVPLKPAPKVNALSSGSVRKYPQQILTNSTFIHVCLLLMIPLYWVYFSNRSFQANLKFYADRILKNAPRFEKNIQETLLFSKVFLSLERSIVVYFKSRNSLTGKEYVCSRFETRTSGWRNINKIIQFVTLSLLNLTVCMSTATQGYRMAVGKI